MHNYGIRLPRYVKKTKKVDDDNGDKTWTYSIWLDTKNFQVVFEVYEGDITKLQGYQEINGHLVFNVKLGEKFQHKARYCDDDCNMDAPDSVTCIVVVSRDSLHIILV